MQATIGVSKAIVFVTIAAFASGCGQSQDRGEVSGRENMVDHRRFVGRDGHVEALADIAAGRVPKLYAHVFNGFAPGWKTPGIEACDPRPSDLLRFEIIPELSFQEGDNVSRPQAPGATKFALDYNRTMFDGEQCEIRKICPNAHLR